MAGGGRWRPGLGGHAADAGAIAEPRASACARRPPASPGDGAPAGCWSSSGRGRPARWAQTDTRLCPFEACAAKCGRPAPHPRAGGVARGVRESEGLAGHPHLPHVRLLAWEVPLVGGSRVWAQLTPPAPSGRWGLAWQGQRFLGPPFPRTENSHLDQPDEGRFASRWRAWAWGRGGAVGGCRGGCCGGTTRPQHLVRWGGRQRHRLQTPCRRLPASPPRPRANCEPTAPHRQLPSPGRSWPACPSLSGPKNARLCISHVRACAVQHVTGARCRSSDCRPTQIPRPGPACSLLARHTV